MDGFQPKVTELYEDFNDALHDAVLSLGGYKKVGPTMWPEKPIDEASQLLRHCLNNERREKLSPDQVRLLLRMARQVEFHGAIWFLADECGYARPQPKNPEDEKARVQRRFAEAVATLDDIVHEAREAGVYPLRSAK